MLAAMVGGKGERKARQGPDIPETCKTRCGVDANFTGE